MAYYLPHRQKMTIDRKLSDAIDMSTQMNRLRDLTNIESIVIWIAHNGSINTGMESRQIYLTCFQEVYEPPFESIRDRIQGVKANNGDLEILKIVRQGSRYAGRILEMPQGFIQQLMANYGGYWLYSFPIGIDHKGFYFVTLVTSKSETPFQQNRGSHIEVLENQLQKVFADVNDTVIRKIRRSLYI